MTALLAQQRKIFRAYDIRGALSILTPALMKDIAQALAYCYRQQGETQVALGYDARLSSHSYAQITAEALTQAGLDVIWIGCVSTPLLYFTAGRYQGNGVMITASHNPIGDNGVKWLIKGFAPTPEQIQQIADVIEAQAYLNQQPASHGRIIEQTVAGLHDYLSYLQQDIQLKKQTKPLRIAIEGLNGSAGWIAEQAFTHLGCEVIGLNVNADGHFPLGSPDPSDVARLDALRTVVTTQSVDFAMALDGDGDRVVLLDEHGNMVNPDRLMCLLAKMCLTETASAQAKLEIVCDVKCSSLLAEVAQRYGGTWRMIRTGSSFLRNDLQHSGACFGGEFAGHYVINDGRGLGFDDGLYVALRVLEYLLKYDLTLSQALAEFPQHLATADLYIANEQFDLTRIIQHFKTVLMSQSHLKLTEIDGLRIDFKDGFGLLRASNTGDYFTVRFDGKNQATLQAIQQFFMTHLQANFDALALAIQQKLHENTLVS